MKYRKNLFSITIRHESISVTDFGSLIGKISMRFPFGAFPDVEWDDFLVIISHWISTLNEIEKGNDDVLYLGFMEGPYQVTITQRQKDMYLLRPEKRLDRSLQWPEVKITKRLLLDVIKRSANDVINYCKKAKIYSKDLEDIKTSISSRNRGEAVREAVREARRGKPGAG